MCDPYFTNEDIQIEKLRLDLEDETEDCMKNAIQAILSMLYELTKQKTQQVFKVPTDNPNDIIVGGLHINNTETVKHNTGTPVIMPQGGTCNCPICRSGK